ncbi:hypothetical protein [Flavobacterium mesophilum]|uniref:hypothetical protein n=1 Tax=Flavobacterium mesophilum TaxID=3143495 RepID=UPI0031D21791
MYSEKELNDQDKEIGKVRYVFLPILFFIIVMCCFADKSKAERNYREANEEAFSGIVKDKEGDEKCIRCPHFIYLRLVESHQVSAFIYSRIEIGDSVVKKAKSDSVYYFKKNGEIIIDDQNRYLREYYFAEMDKNNSTSN